jgi:hypothetical protein
MNARTHRSASFFALTLFLVGVAVPAAAQDCPEEPQLQHYTGGGQVVCPCFVPGEEAGAVFDIPAEHFPIEVLRVGIGWASQFGGAAQTLEQAIHVYGAGLPDPGARVLSLGGPVLSDGAINVFDLEAQLLSTEVATGPVTVTLEFLNQNAGDPFAPSVVHDGNGCQLTKNVVKAIPAGWSDACPLGVTGDWVFFMVYRRTDCNQIGVGEEIVTANLPVFLSAPHPNPFRAQTQVEFVLAEAGDVRLAVFDLAGRRVATLWDGPVPAGRHGAVWNGRVDRGPRAPSGIYFITLDSAAGRRTQKILVRD